MRTLKTLAWTTAALVLAGLVGCAPAIVKKDIIIWNSGIRSSDDSGTVKKEDLPLFKNIAAFEKDNPGVKVTVVDYSMDQLTQAFTAANMAKTGPDIVALWAGSTTFGYNDYLVAFDKSLSPEEKVFYGASNLVKRNGDSKGDIIGLTSSADAGTLYYNKAILAQAGVDPATIKTFADLTAAAKAIRAKTKVDPVAVGDANGYVSTWVMCTFLGNLLGPDGLQKLGKGEVKMAGPEFTKAFQAWEDFVKLGFTNKDFISLDDGGALKAFVAGKAAFLIHGTWSVSEYSSMGDNVGVVPIPAISADAPFVDYIYSQPNINLIVTNYSKNVDTAVALARKLSSPAFKAETDASAYKTQNVLDLLKITNSWLTSGKVVIGFDSLVKSEAANEFYKLAPTVLGGRLSLADFAAKLDTLNGAK